MAQTVLITGSSSGIGKATAFFFAARGWNVAATMRNSGIEKDFEASGNITLYDLDVTDVISIHRTFKKVREDFGSPDVVVNNAGYSIDGPFEGITDEAIEKLFNTNVFGMMRVTREAIRMMRENGGGKIIQISSIGGRLTFPLYSLYHSTKWAVEGFSESLHYELDSFNIQLKIIEPGFFKTEFYGRNRQFIKPDHTPVYDAYLKKFETAATKEINKAGDPQKVAATIYKAALDDSNRMRYPVGKPAPLLLWLRKRIPDTWFFTMVKKKYKV